ncbi:AraC family transcriptional regulator [Saccharopolyspora dendranthemae]|uniref:AraC family transcriptional regulator n=2 Tax=Saccharopolyspora dendranthemae TaxID=1181886 RepID=A0A561V8E2_9PSEU|nr:AraC family transcriptional regulator [Saccharopolyspora dendranthemae]
MTAMTAERARVWLWPGQAAYLGPQLRWDLHSTPVHCLAFGVDDAFVVHAPDGVWHRRSALIPARLPHRIEAGAGRMLFHYLDSRTDSAGVRELMAEALGTITATHRDELAVLDHVHEPDELHRFALGAPSQRCIDRRIRAAMDSLLAEPERERDAGELAAEFGLSKSRFLHLFSENAGTSFRRFRVWSRMLRVGAAVEAGASLTTAATDAGFASASHFSDTFRRMFGLSATTLLAGGTQITTAPAITRSAPAHRP